MVPTSRAYVGKSIEFCLQQSLALKRDVNSRQVRCAKGWEEGRHLGRVVATEEGCCVEARRVKEGEELSLVGAVLEV